MFLLFAQNKQTQTVKGIIKDQQGAYTLPYVSITILAGSDTLKGNTNENGEYSFENVPVGRISVFCNMMGYKPTVLQNLDLTSGKQLVLNIELEEQINQLNEVVITSKKSSKLEVNNEFTTVSTRKFTIEETKRYAGALQDVARMATNFAGVQSNNDSNNDIVVRGNTPFFLLWRMEDADIPNPNHFGGLGATGGPVSMLNNNYLEDSDFMTGAFPAGYGNGISGVFDLKLRHGNTSKYEFLGQVGFNGFEAGVEGPISKNNKSSFYAGYRYSTLGLLSKIGTGVGTGAAIPNYQDAIFNIHLPTKSAGQFTLFGFGGFSGIEFKNATKSVEESKDVYGAAGIDLYYGTTSGMIGLKHLIFLNDKNSLNTTIYRTYGALYTRVDTADGFLKPQKNYLAENNEQKTGIHSYFNNKINAKSTLRIGTILSLYNVAYRDTIYGIRRRYNTTGETTMSQFYINYQYKFSDKFRTTIGLHSSILSLSPTPTLEPRIGFAYDLSPKTQLTVGYGNHSQHAPFNIYLRENDLGEKTNKNLKLIRSNEFVLGVRQLVSAKMYLKAEVYYQKLYNVVVDKKSSTFSILNLGSISQDLPEEFSNSGKGQNYGVDLTLEKFLDRGYYFMVTGSVYNSTAQASDGVWRNTAYNSRHSMNTVVGKDFGLGTSKKGNTKKITVDSKFNWTGGKYYTPINEEASKVYGDAVYDYNQAFKKQLADYMRFDLRISYVINHKKSTETFALDLQNFTNRRNPYFQTYDKKVGELKTVYQIGFLPLFLYKITF